MKKKFEAVKRFETCLRDFYLKINFKITRPIKRFMNTRT